MNLVIAPRLRFFQINQILSGVSFGIEKSGMVESSR
jgi:hypothetical protein